MRVIGRESVSGLAAYFSSLVHESVRGDVLTAARHQSFIASHLLGGLLALAGFVANKLKSSRSESANWQSSYVPTPPPAPASPSAATTGVSTTGAAADAAAAAPVTGDPLTDPLPDEVTADDVVTVDPPATDDTGGGAPGEAISDEVVEPHDPTTPENPADIVDIDDAPQK